MPNYVLRTGSITIINPTGRRMEDIVVDDRFESKKQLRKLLFKFKDTGVIITVRFDDPVSRLPEDE